MSTDPEQTTLHWNLSIERKGLGTLLKKVNHIAITVSDVGRSLAFYVEVLGLQQIRRPNFDRHGAWLTLGNVELHLIKGNPVVPTGDNLIVGHISIETDNTEEVLKQLIAMGIPLSLNVSVPDALESRPITQYFIRDPDGYYIEICDCDILTDFCLSKDEKSVGYSEVVQNMDLSQVFKFAYVVESIIQQYGDEASSVLPEDQQAKEADPVKLQNMLGRCTIYGDLMQGETADTIADALKKANNHVPTATRIIKARKNGKHMLLPPAFYLQAVDRYQPEFIGILEQKQKVANPKRSYVEIATGLFKTYDQNGDGYLDKEEIKKILLSLGQISDDATVARLFKQEYTNNGRISLQEFLDSIDQMPPLDDTAWKAFFDLLDVDRNGKITCPEICQMASRLGLVFGDDDMENVFIEGDLDGDGTLSILEAKQLFMRCEK